MLETAELLAFATTVDAMSISRAARELRIPRATLGRRLAVLEEKLGVRLLRRTTRSLVMTDAGDALYRHARLVIDAAVAAEASVRRADGAVRGDLRVSLPHMSGPLQEAIADFAVAHPEVRLQVHVSSRMVDLQREGYDVAIRATGELEPGLVARTLAKTALVGVASPKYAAPKSLAELRRHRCLMGFSRGELPQTHWIAGGKKLHLEGAAFSNNPALLCRLAERGQGVAFVPESIAAEGIARGTLVVVLPKLLRSEGSISIVYADRELMPPQVRAFVDWMIARRDALSPSAPSAAASTGSPTRASAPRTPRASARGTTGPQTRRPRRR